MTEGGTAFGARLSSFRRKAGLSQEELAERSGLSIRAISNLECGRTKWPRPDTVRRLADALSLVAGVRAEFTATAERRLAARGAPGDGAELASTAVPVPQPSPAANGIPRQLPGPVRQFTGRQKELAVLTRLLDARDSEPAAVLIPVIVGMAGVGKTALAVQWAHHVAHQFPDGQLYIDLRGYDPAAAPVPPGEVLGGFLRALGMTGQHIPEALDERAAVFRSLLAGKRVLVVLDNARNVAQVRPLLPGSPGCMALVTSRNALGGLVAADGALRLRLDTLPLPEAVNLLQGLIGDRVADDREASARLADQCGRLPLALRVSAELAATRDGVALADLTTELADVQHRLEVLETGEDQRTTVRAVFSWSYADLKLAAASMFRLVGLHPGLDISAAAAASLAGLPAAQARRALGELTRAHLLQEHIPGRFSCHDLLRGYAAEQAAATDGPAQQRAAVQRLLTHYLHTAYAADRLLHPSRPELALPALEPGVQPESPADADQAMAWFEAEHKVLLAVIASGAAAGLHRHTWQLAWSTSTYLDVRAHWADLTEVMRVALRSATHLGDEAAQAMVRDKLGFSLLLRGQYAAAAEHFNRSLQQFRRLKDQIGEARVYLNVSFLLELQGHLADAVLADQRGLEAFQTAGYQVGEALALNAAGWHLALLGQHQEALTCCQQALATQRKLGDRYDEANTWDSLGYIHDRLGEHDQAARCYQASLRLLAPGKERWRQATVLLHLGDSLHSVRNTEAARDAWRQALTIFDDMHHRDAEAVRAKLAGRR